MSSRRTLLGKLTQYERPDWDPLIDLVGLVLVHTFMWMNEIVLEDGVHMQAYKHIDTRQYLHIAADGRLFEYRTPGRYREVDRSQALEVAFFAWDPRDDDALGALDELLSKEAT